MTAGQASFSRFDECTEEDMELIADNFQSFAKGLPDRVLANLNEKYDMPSFDKDSESMSLDAFEPMLRNVLTK